MPAPIGQLLIAVQKKNATLPKGRRFNPFGKSRQQIEQFLGISGGGQLAPKAQLKQRAIQAIQEKRRQLEARGLPVTKEALRAAAVKAMEHKAKIATEGAVVAAGVTGGAIGGPVLGAMAAAGTRASIRLGKQFHTRLQQQRAAAINNNAAALAKMAKAAGGQFISDLKDLKLQKQLERGVQGDLLYGAIATAVGSVAPIPGLGDAAAVALSGKATNALQTAIRRTRKREKSK